MATVSAVDTAPGSQNLKMEWRDTNMDWPFDCSNSTNWDTPPRIPGGESKLPAPLKSALRYTTILCCGSVQYTPYRLLASIWGSDLTPKAGHLIRRVPTNIVTFLGTPG
ncbi:MAG TPA: hypothetical protein VGN61_05610, partial [Verrucomicrobiae bacterium]